MIKYRIKRNYATKLWLILFLSVLFIIFGISIPYLDGETYNKSTIIMPVIFVIIFSFPAILSIRALLSIPKLSVISDNDGLWLDYLTKSGGFIPWKDIAYVKERTFMQCLDLFDSNRNKIIRVEYQLEGFKGLRDLILDNLSKNIKDNLPRMFKKELLYKVINYLSCLLLIGLVLLIYNQVGFLYGIISFGFCFYIIYELLFVSISKVIIDFNCIYIHSPLKRIVINFSDIEKISYKTERYKGNEIPYVSIKLKSRKKPYKIKGLNIEPNIMLLALKRYCK